MGKRTGASVPHIRQMFFPYPSPVTLLIFFLFCKQMEKCGMRQRSAPRTFSLLPVRRERNEVVSATSSPWSPPRFPGGTRRLEAGGEWCNARIVMACYVLRCQHLGYQAVYKTCCAAHPLVPPPYPHPPTHPPLPSPPPQSSTNPLAAEGTTDDACS